MADQPDDYKEKEVIKGLQKEAKAILKTLEAFTRVRSNDPNILDKLYKALDAMPSGPEIAQSIQSFQSTARSTLDTVLQLRIDSVKKVETTYIQNQLGLGKSVREFNNGWRVGPLEMQFNRQLASVSSWYNNENVIKWQSIADMEDIERIEKKSIDMLAGAAIPADIMIPSFWQAYQEAKGRSGNRNDSALVAITDFYRELRIVLVRQRITGKRLHRKINKYIDFPRWAFLYNLDIYRSLSAGLPDEQRLTLQTGSMNEVSKGNGYVVNGLDARNEYKVMCYIRPAVEVR